nr:SDR family oxidoreductase [Halorubrum rubrum]
MTELILVTGATGTVGQHVVTALSDRDVTIKIGVRDPETVSNEIADAGELIEFDFTKPETWGRALTDVDGVFLVRPPVVDKSEIGAFVEAADRVGVARIAYLSTLGAEKNVLVPHHWIEKRITATDMEYTLLRASFFMQNLLEVHRGDIVEYGEIFVPAGNGETSFVDARDIGETAAIVLTESGHTNQAYDLTGPEALDYEEVAAVFSDVLNRPIRYPDPSLLAFGRRMHRRGKPLGFIALMCGIYTTVRLGLATRVTDDSQHLLGRRPRGMRAFVEDHADDFHGDSQPHRGSSGNSAGSGYVETRRPPLPDVAYELVNPVMSRLLRSPLHSLVSDSIPLLTFIGSRTGNEYTTPVGYWVKDGHLVVTPTLCISHGASDTT